MRGPVVSRSRTTKRASASGCASPGRSRNPRRTRASRSVTAGGRLRRTLRATGFTDVGTFIASGNVVFGSTATAGPALEAKIEAALKKAFGFDVPTFVRPLAAVSEAAARRPFPAVLARKL